MIKFSGPQGPWEAVFAWKPVKINAKWYWLTTVYRRELNQYVWPPQGWEFGDTFDVLRDA